MAVIKLKVIYLLYSSCYIQSFFKSIFHMPLTQQGKTSLLLSCKKEFYKNVNIKSYFYEYLSVWRAS
jgi:hypothetical protein